MHSPVSAITTNSETVWFATAQSDHFLFFVLVHFDKTYLMLLFSEHLGGWMIKTQQLCLSERIGNLQCRPVEHSENNTRANSYGGCPNRQLAWCGNYKEKSFYAVENGRP